MTAVSDSIVFRHLFSTPESSEIWSDHKRTQYYLDFEAALAVAQARLGIIPKEAGDLIKSKCRAEFMDMEELGEETRRIGYPVLPVVKQLVRSVNEVKEGLGEWAHWGATTQDVTDTATVLQLRDTCGLVSDSLDAMIDALRDLALRYKSTPMAARSNLQQAVPITFGFKMARLLATFQRHRQRLGEILPRLLVVEFGGAAGTLATISDTGLAFQVQEGLAAELGLNTPEIAWHTERDRITEIGTFFALLTGTCAKFAFDVKLLMQTEVAEISEPFAPHRGSSSTMPQKRNPISSVYITALASTVNHLSGALFDAMVEDHERSTGPWEIEWIVLPQISTLTHAALKHTLELLRGIEVYPDTMKKNLDLTNGAIVSEAVMMALGKKIGRQVAHDLVYEICRQAAMDRSVSFLDRLEDNEIVKKSGISREELEKLCDPANYVGLSEDMVLRVTGGRQD
ncbi:L-Aspartase-like protein [Gymnopilus junonius]|uniref:L-Aspartase-like protein n=1 Tax=Gymnopilus junonius TaxID=109634 RepID=A0A9P5TR65_GYMJU|nr:L-Aspartase-like protein [Gymnopilus junonius]